MSPGRYAEYARVGRAVDSRDHQAWREGEAESLLDAPMLRQRADKLEALVAAGDATSLAKCLRTELRRNLGAMGNPALYQRCVIGTAAVVGRYNAAVLSAVRFLSESSFPDFDDQAKEMAFRNTRQAYGGSALLFSGGASLGMLHFGVARLIHEEIGLPKVLSGSSIGSLIVALLAVRTDVEVTQLLHDIEHEAIDFGQPFEPDGSGLRKLRRLLDKGVLMDIAKLTAVIRRHVGDVTFLEAYQRTGRIVNITVSSTRPCELPLLLNYLTAPDVLLWSASAASCALPFLYEPVELLAKDGAGEIRPYHPSGLRFSDGSVGSDLPMRRLAELFNINQFIVSQVNPHMLFLLDRSNEGLLAKIKYLVRSELSHRLLQLLQLNLLPRALGFLSSAFAQPFEGDITIVPKIRWRHWKLLLSNPTPQALRKLANHGYRSAFYACEMIRDRTAIERALEKAILDVNARLLASEQPSSGTAAAAAAVSGTSSIRARLTHSTAFLCVTDNAK